MLITRQGATVTQGLLCWWTSILMAADSDATLTSVTRRVHSTWAVSDQQHIAGSVLQQPAESFLCNTATYRHTSSCVPLHLDAVLMYAAMQAVDLQQLPGHINNPQAML